MLNKKSVDDINVKGGHISGTMLLKKNKNVTSVTGSYTIEKTHTKKNFQAVSDMYLFARNRGGVFRAAQMKCYYFKIWDNGTLVRDFIPVLSPTDEPCMYDKVTKGLFCNQGSGDFITD